MQPGTSHHAVHQRRDVRVPGLPPARLFPLPRGFRAQVTVAVALLVTLGAVFHGLGLKSLGAEFGKMALLRCAFEFTAGMCVCYTWAHFYEVAKDTAKGDVLDPSACACPPSYSRCRLS